MKEIMHMWKVLDNPTKKDLSDTIGNDQIWYNGITIELLYLKRESGFDDLPSAWIILDSEDVKGPALSFGICNGSGQYPIPSQIVDALEDRVRRHSIVEYDLEAFDNERMFQELCEKCSFNAPLSRSDLDFLWEEGLEFRMLRYVNDEISVRIFALRKNHIIDALSAGIELRYIVHGLSYDPVHNNEHIINHIDVLLRNGCTIQDIIYYMDPGDVELYAEELKDYGATDTDLKCTEELLITNIFPL